MSLFQGDVNLTATVQLDLMDDIFNQIAVTKTDAIVYLTIYPIRGLIPSPLYKYFNHL